MNKILLSLAVCLFIVNLASGLDKSQCKCRVKTDRRIVGGRISNAEKWRWQVSISRFPNFPKKLRKFFPTKFKIGWHTCGGSILNERWILTAAHCLNNEFLLGNQTYIGSGSNDLAVMFDNGRIKAKRSIQHPEYRVGHFDNDIALIELEEPLKLDNNTQPGCLDREATRDYSSNLIITGFGVTSKVYIDKDNQDNKKIGQASRYLKEADMKDVSNVDLEFSEICKKQKGMVCLLPSVNKEDSACIGESGGPLNYIKNGRSLISGVASGINTAEVKGDKLVVCTGPIIYTRVGYYIDFIKEYINEDDLC